MTMESPEDCAHVGSGGVRWDPDGKTLRCTQCDQVFTAELVKVIRRAGPSAVVDLTDPDEENRESVVYWKALNAEHLATIEALEEEQGKAIAALGIDWGEVAGSLMKAVEITMTRLKGIACVACGGDGFYHGPRLGDEPCQACQGEGIKKGATLHAALAVVQAVRNECAKFRFPDEDRPDLWDALRFFAAVSGEKL